MQTSRSAAIPLYAMHVVLPLLLCGYIYTFCRPDGIGLQYIVGAVVGTDTLATAKQLYDVSYLLDEWVIYSMPAMLWTFSVGLLACMFDIDRQRRRYLVAAIPLALTLALELLQWIGWSDGTFDLADIAAGWLGYGLALLYMRTHHQVIVEVEHITVRRLVFALVFACVYVGDVWVG